MDGFNGYIGVFDSGVGGISVLKELVRELPHERFLFFGDSAHAPYGDKGADQIARLSRRIVGTMVDGGCKAIVIACNTATSAAADGLRALWPEVPIVGIEPALKPAAEAPENERILVMATAATLRLEKFHELARAWGSSSEIRTLACPGLADLIETGRLDSPAVHAYLEEKLAPYRGLVDAVVLGCTHYPFVKKQIRDILGPVPFFDGAPGTARQLHRKLEDGNLAAPALQRGEIVFRSSIGGDAQQALYERLFNLPTE